MRLEPLVLRGRVVQLEPLVPDHAIDLLDAADADRSTFSHTVVPGDLPAMQDYITGLLRDAAADSAMPFAQRRLSDGRLLGCTRFMNLAWWAGPAAPAEVEIGGTWLAAIAQRSAVNSEAKLLLLEQAFDRWSVHRVAICTDARNERSRRAIERLGATFEGVLRNHRPAMGSAAQPGTARDSACYSIIPSEWPDIRARLRAGLGSSAERDVDDGAVA